MIVSLIAALDRNGLIGADNRLPWHLPADLARFKALTMGKPVIMGRRTHESIGRPLPGRRNIVLSRDPAFSAPGCVVVRGVEEALAAAGVQPEVFVIGGASFYAQLIGRAQRLYLTLIDAAFEGDTFFPAYRADEWIEVTREDHAPDARNAYPFSFVVLERRG